MQAAPSRSGRLAEALHRLADDHAIPQLLPVVAILRGIDGSAGPAADYLTIRGALAQTAVVAAELTGEADRTRIDAWLAGEDVALITMAAAIAVVEEAGASVDRGDDARSHLDRARYWRGYGAGPVGELHRRCAQDISRGSLRLLDGRARPPTDARVELQRLRLQLATAGRDRWAAARRELVAVGPRAGFERRVRDHLARQYAAADAESARGLTDIGAGVAELRRPWPMPSVPGPTGGLRPDERRLGVVLGAGFGLGVALAVMRLLTGIVGLGEVGGALCGALVGVVLTGWVVVVRARVQARVVLERWAVEAIGVVRMAAEDQLARRLLDAQQHLASQRSSVHHKSRN